MEFDSPYQSYEYMAKMEKYFREKIAKEIAEIWQKTDNPSNLTYADGLADAAAIARGQK